MILLIIIFLSLSVCHFFISKLLSSLQCFSKHQVNLVFAWSLFFANFCLLKYAPKRKWLFSVTYFSNRILVYHKFATQKSLYIFFYKCHTNLVFITTQGGRSWHRFRHILSCFLPVAFYIAASRSLPVAIPTFRCCSPGYLLSAGRIDRISSWWFSLFA